MKRANPRPVNTSFLLYENIKPNPSTVAKAIIIGCTNDIGDRLVTNYPLASLTQFCSTGRMNTPFRAAIAICEISISTPNVSVLDFGAGIFCNGLLSDIVSYC